MEVGGRRVLPSVWALSEESCPCLRGAAGKPCSQPGVRRAGDRDRGAGGMLFLAAQGLGGGLGDGREGW